jgi:hypothetical protein
VPVVRDGQHHCGACQRIATRVYRAAHPEWQRVHDLTYAATHGYEISRRRTLKRAGDHAALAAQRLSEGEI